jgi:hypothetical protein
MKKVLRFLLRVLFRFRTGDLTVLNPPGPVRLGRASRINLCAAQIDKLWRRGLRQRN